jgi:prepilin signal peptidase PulO-like enzyme (type II secretory pathway)
VPFGIFLALGAAASYLVGPEILEWYGRFVIGA